MCWADLDAVAGTEVAEGFFTWNLVIDGIKVIPEVQLVPLKNEFELLAREEGRRNAKSLRKRISQDL